MINLIQILQVTSETKFKIVEKNVDEPCLGEPLSETVFQIKNEDDEVIIKGDGTLYIG